MNDLEIIGTYRKGNKGMKVKLIQEWLNLNGIELAIDGDYGPATEYGVKEFQKLSRLTSDGIVGPMTFEMLIAPMTRANVPLEHFEFIEDKIIQYAEQHLAQEPKEVGGQNMGPWVRMYMNGYQGNNWPWCAGFVIYILKQAYGNDEIPLVKSFSVDAIVSDAMKKGLFVNGFNVKNSFINPGSLWVLRREWGDWTHIGIVTELEDEVFIAIEGNTNIEGEREGIEVARKIRSYKNKDFIVFFKD